MSLAIVTKIFHFDSAHYLPGYPGICEHLHGHTWKVEVSFQGLVDSKGMVVDFALIKQLVDPIVETLDHSLLNNTIQNPTAENIALWFRDKIASVQGLPPLRRVKVWESPDSCAEVELE